MFNKTILVGNLSRDIELRYSQGGMAIAKTGIATNRKFKKQNGEQMDETMFIDLTFFARSAEIANQYLRKGSKVLIEGRLTLEQWTDQNGQKRSKHSITVEEMKMLDSNPNAQPQASQGYTPPQQQAPQGYNPQQAHQQPAPPQQQAPQGYTPPQQQAPQGYNPQQQQAHQQPQPAQQGAGDYDPENPPF